MTLNKSASDLRQSGGVYYKYDHVGKNACTAVNIFVGFDTLKMKE